MKSFTTILLAGIATSIAFTPLANAQSRHDPRPPAHHQLHKKPVAKHQVKPAKKHWKKGSRYSDWRKHKRVDNYSRYGLRRPGHGQQWVKVDNDYLLVSIATGIIAGR
jgi:Ni/Co efflux regulator RcnB